MTPEEAEAIVRADFAATSVLVGDGGWVEDSLWVSCARRDGDELVQLTSSFRREGPFSTDLEELTSKVVSIWRERGMDAEVAVESKSDPLRYVVSSPPFLRGSHDDGSLTQLFVSSNNVANFIAYSPCAVGNLIDLNPDRPYSTGEG